MFRRSARVPDVMVGLRLLMGSVGLPDFRGQVDYVLRLTFMLSQSPRSPDLEGLAANPREARFDSVTDRLLSGLSNLTQRTE